MGRIAEGPLRGGAGSGILLRDMPGEIVPIAAFQIIPAQKGMNFTGEVGRHVLMTNLIIDREVEEGVLIT